MARNQKDITYDADLQLHDGVAAITADGGGVVGGSAKILDLGEGRADGRAIIDLDALTTGGAAPETYDIIAQFSDSPTFASGIVNGPRLKFGAAASTGASAANAAGERHELPFASEVNGEVYRYMRLYVDVAGTAPSIDFTAFAALKA